MNQRNKVSCDFITAPLAVRAFVVGRFPRELRENGVRYLEEEREREWDESSVEPGRSQSKCRATEARKKNKERFIGGGRNRWMDTDIILRGGLI